MCFSASHANSDSRPNEGHHSVIQQTLREAQYPSEPVLWSHAAQGLTAAHQLPDLVVKFVSLSVTQGPHLEMGS